jgi:hypothetical protein
VSISPTLSYMSTGGKGEGWKGLKGYPPLENFKKGTPFPLKLFLTKFGGKLQNLGGKQQNFNDFSQNFYDFSQNFELFSKFLKFLIKF